MGDVIDITTKVGTEESELLTAITCPVCHGLDFMPVAVGHLEESEDFTVTGLACTGECGSTTILDLENGKVIGYSVSNLEFDNDN